MGVREWARGGSEGWEQGCTAAPKRKEQIIGVGACDSSHLFFLLPSRIPAFARRIKGQSVNGLLRLSKHSLTHSQI